MREEKKLTMDHEDAMNINPRDILLLQDFIWHEKMARFNPDDNHNCFV